MFKAKIKKICMISDDSTIYVASRRQMYIPKYWERLIWYVKEAAPLKDPNLNEYGKQIKFPSDFLFFCFKTS